MFQFPGCPPMRLFDSSHGDGTLLPPGFPIRISADQTLACSSPQLIAACYVLFRQSVPWHPPCALISLIYFLRRSASKCESLLIHIPSTSLRLVCFWFSLSLCSFQGAGVTHEACAARITWWAEVDSNHRPHAYQACALTN